MLVTTLCEYFVFDCRSKRGNVSNEAFRDAYGKLAILRSMCKEGKFFVTFCF